MSGSNKVLKPAQVLFRAGDKSDGMYLIRKGELRVYLEQDGKEVALATIGAGGMIGEMALFDQQPRSASVKAVGETEVTHITNEDFGKLMKQIPKWFVGLMSALSGRLRQTNERLQKLESSGGGGGGAAKGKPYQGALRMLHVVILIWHRDGEKDGKDWVVPRATVEQTLTGPFAEDPEKVKHFLEVLIREKAVTARLDGRKTNVLATGNRALLGQVAAFIEAWLKLKPAAPCLPDHALATLRTLDKLAQASPYDQLTAAVSDLQRQGKTDGVDTSKWNEAVALIPATAEEVRPVKTSTGMGLRTTKKDAAAYSRMHDLIAALYKANIG